MESLHSGAYATWMASGSLVLGTGQRDDKSMMLRGMKRLASIGIIVIAGASCAGLLGIEETTERQVIDAATEESDASSESDASTPPMLCGDGVTDPLQDEECDEDVDDDGVADNTATCDEDCTAPACRDSVFNPAAEVCDTGGNTASCDADCTTPSCGDGHINPLFDPDGPGPATGEDCDTSGVETTTCDLDCTTRVCGDGTRNATAGEVCDEGGNTASCDADCTTPSCGDGHANPMFDPDGPGPATGEDCDTSGVETATCDLDCTTRVCGDETVNMTAGEQCDDGNLTSGDGCSASCQLEACQPSSYACKTNTNECIAGPCAGDFCIDSSDCSSICVGGVEECAGGPL